VRMNESTHKVRTVARGGPRSSPPSAAPGAGTRPAIRHILRGPRPQARLEVGRADDPAEAGMRARIIRRSALPSLPLAESYPTGRDGRNERTRP